MGRAAWIGAAVLWLAACNDHPLQPLDEALVAAERLRLEVPPRTKIDLLFVVDDSGSMGEEQANLARNFGVLADFLLAGLATTADFRVAVTSTDLRARGGAFARSDDPACADVPLVLRSGPDAADLQRQFACLTDLGTRGSNLEKGLEAMRLALSCDGPNAGRLAPCCRPGPDGRPTFDPECAGEPEFLRPDALLVVVVVADEDDCSDPAANPAASALAVCRTGRPEGAECDGLSAERCRAELCDIEEQTLLAICRHGTADADADGVPDGYDDPVYCPPGRAADCLRADCGALDAEACARERCGGDEGPDRLNVCSWFRHRLTPVEDYARFLFGLKRDPGQQIVVAAITGRRLSTEDGREAAFHLPRRPLDPACAPADPEAAPAFEATEACCPGGRCEGPPRAACVSANGRAAAGTRYLDLAAHMGENGLGISICTDDFAAPLAEIRDRVHDALRTFCLDRPPACRVRDADGRPAPCADDDRLDPANYGLRVQVSCRERCAEPFAARELPPDAFELVPDACAGGFAIRLDPPPPPGADLVVDYVVAP